MSLAVFREGRALVARRARAPLRGLYSLPGGVVEIGETLREAALRELDEEVGVKAEIVAFNDHVESIIRDDSGGVQAHYVIASFVGRWIAGEARTSEEADSVIWLDPAGARRSADHAGTVEHPRQSRRSYRGPHMSRRLCRLAFAAAFCAAVSGQADAQQTAAKPPAPAEQPAPAPAAEPPPPYEPQLLRLAELMGALSLFARSLRRP